MISILLAPTFIYLSGLAVFLRTIRLFARQTSLWQTKEYRLDRVLLHLQNTTLGRRSVNNPLEISKWLFLIFIWFTHSPISLFGILALEMPEIISLFHEIKNHSLKRPKKITGRIFVISLIAIISLLGAFRLSSKLNHGFSLLLIDRLAWLAVAIGVAVSAAPAILYKRFIVLLASRKRASLTNLTVIGITGSVGKTSTKEFLLSLLSTKFATVATQDHDNTDIGIARSLLFDVDEKTQVFIAEMGAYKIGEIKAMCMLVKPSIGIITTIGVQHLELFGSLKNIRKAKTELIENLSGQALSVLNLDNQETEKLARHLKEEGKKTTTYAVLRPADIFAKDINQNQNGISFTLEIDKRETPLTAPLFGIHMVSNILAAIAVAVHLGLSTNEIKRKLASLMTLPDELGKITGPRGTVCFDDTYNASPESVAADIQLLNSYPGIKYRILVFQPMIELGQVASQAHNKIGKYVADKKLDLLILTNPNFSEEIESGAGKEKSKIKVLLNYSEVVPILESHLSPSTAIIFKGKESQGVLRHLLKHK